MDRICNSCSKNIVGSDFFSLMNQTFCSIECLNVLRRLIIENDKQVKKLQSEKTTHRKPDFGGGGF
uniref:FLZ-type domain-containing protein n=1 Tax=viral metagenome TaxID=1070528 RepID=A0A6C0BC43_9ZZZZ